jgi:hypothetical protein
MSTVSKERLSTSEKKRLEKALIRLVGSTRRSHRTKNLLEVSTELAIAEKLLGSRKDVAKRIGLSEEMLREFASVTKLDKSVQQMVKKGLISSVDVAYRISMLSKEEQLHVAKAYIDNQLSGSEIKDIIPLFKRYPNKPIKEAIEKVKSSRDITQYSIRFRVYKNVRKKILQNKFADMLGDGNIVSWESDGKIANLTITEEGRKILQKEAKKRGITKRKFINLMIERE